MEAGAQARYIRVTPMKARRVVDLIRGLALLQGTGNLAVCAAGRDRTGRQGAQERHRQRHQQQRADVNGLVITEARVDEGPHHEAIPPACPRPRVPDPQAYEPHHHRCRNAGRRSDREGEEVTAVGQKSKPHGFRLGISTDFTSRWFADSAKEGQRYRDYVNEDVKIQKLMTEGMERAGISKVEIGARVSAFASTSTLLVPASSSAVAVQKQIASAASWRSSPASRSS